MITEVRKNGADFRRLGWHVSGQKPRRRGKIQELDHRLAELSAWGLFCLRAEPASPTQSVNASPSRWILILWSVKRVCMSGMLNFGMWEVTQEVFWLARQAMPG